MLFSNYYARTFFMGANRSNSQSLVCPFQVAGLTLTCSRFSLVFHSVFYICIYEGFVQFLNNNVSLSFSWLLFHTNIFQNRHCMCKVGCTHGPHGDNDPGLSPAETRSHFGAWSIVSSPLTLSHDVNNDTIMDAVQEKHTPYIHVHFFIYVDQVFNFVKFQL
jgi:hypothetical protein